MGRLDIIKDEFTFSELQVFSDGVPVVRMFAEYSEESINKEDAILIIDHLKQQFGL